MLIIFLIPVEVFLVLGMMSEIGTFGVYCYETLYIDITQLFCIFFPSAIRGPIRHSLGVERGNVVTVRWGMEVQFSHSTMVGEGYLLSQCGDGDAVFY